MVLSHLQGPGNGKAGAEGSHRHPADVIAGQLRRTLALNPGPSTLREGAEAIDLLEDTREELGALDGVEATECWSKRRMTDSTALLVLGINLLSMPFTGVDQCRSRNSKMTAEAGVSRT